MNKSILVGRTQAVVLEGETSPELQVLVTCGVPQSSLLGPLLFLLYINDLPYDIQSQVRLFASDTAVNSPNDMNTLQADLDTLQKMGKNLGHGV